MKRLLFALFITAMLFSLTSCGTEDCNTSKMDGNNDISLTDQTEETSEIEKVNETKTQGGGETLEKSIFNFETKTVMLNSGYEMPLVGLGTYSLDYDTCVASVTALLDKGGRLIDTAYMYHNESGHFRV